MSINAQSVLWIDGVGGYAMCDRASTTLGNSTATGELGLRIASDLPSRAVVFHHQGQDLLLEPLHSVFLNGKEITAIVLLKNGDRMRLGSSVELEFLQPTLLSGTAALTIRSRHRWHGSIDGAILLGSSCVIGPSPRAHIRCKNWEKDIVFFRYGDQWMIRNNEYTADGLRNSVGTRPVIFGERIQGSDFSMTWL